MPGPLLLLGPQRPTPNIAEALATVPGDGPVVTITAGWRHDEADDAALHRAIGPDAVSLPLYAWFEEAMAELPDLREAYKSRQAQLLELKEIYRLRLHPGLDAVRHLLARQAGDPALVTPQLEGALRHLREIEAGYLQQADQIYAAHGGVQRPWVHPAVRERRAQAAAMIQNARAIAIAGGHVAVLRNRLMFFGVHQQIVQAWMQGVAVVCWSAGSMVMTERIVLFYDDPPDGPSHPELLDEGFGLAKDLVVLPHARRRLRLEDRQRVSLLASRFAPSMCVGLENGSWLSLEGGRWLNRGVPGTALHLRTGGDVTPVEQA